MILDRCATSLDDVWSSLDYKIFDSEKEKSRVPPITPQEAAGESSSIVTDRIQPTSTLLAGTSHHLTAGRVTSIRSSATSDGTASPISYTVSSEPRATSLIPNVICEPQQTTTTTTPPPEVISIKEEQIDDFERLIDSVRSGSSSSSNNLNNKLVGINGSVSTSSSSGNNPRHTPRGSFTGEFVEYTVKSEQRLSTDQVPAAVTQNESRDSGISVKSEALDTPPIELANIDTGGGIYDEFLNEIEQSWLHFRPKTPPPPTTPPMDDFSEIVEQETMQRLISSAPFNVELQTLDYQLPQALFAEQTSTFVTSEPLALDSVLMEEESLVKAASPDLGKGKCLS